MSFLSLMGGPTLSRSMGGVTPVYSWDFSTALPAEVTASGGANGTRVNSSGVIVSATTPRHDYDPVSLEALGVWCEGQRTNIIAFSSEFNANWTGGNESGVDSYGAGPRGASSTTRLIDNNTGGTANVYYLKSQGVGLSTTYVFSAYAKEDQLSWLSQEISGYTVPATGEVYFDLSSGSIGTEDVGLSGEIFPAAEGFYRTCVTFTTGGADNSGAIQLVLSDGDNDRVVDKDGTSSILLDAAVLEAGAFPSSYIHTTGSQVTRTADSLMVTSTNFSDTWNSEEGCVVITCDSPGIGTRVIWQVDDGTANNRITIYTDAANLKAEIYVGGVEQDAITIGTITPYTQFRVALSWIAGVMAGALNGGAAVEGAPASIPTVDRARLGANTSAGNELFGHIKSMNYYNAFQ